MYILDRDCSEAVFCFLWLGDLLGPSFDVLDIECRRWPANARHKDLLKGSCSKCVATNLYAKLN